MKIIGIIAEYNPFHNGHAYQINAIRQKTNADYVVVAMSGDFMQRGTPAILDKYARTKMALSCGADLVIELPVLWATSSAESFAMAGITLFDKMGCTDGICFGAETDDLALLMQLSELLVEEPALYRNALSSYLKNGVSFPAARAYALCDYLMDKSAYDTDTLRAVLSEPNNILAIEYLKAIKKRGSSLVPHIIKREGAGYHDTAICAVKPSAAPTASATAIRSLLQDEYAAVARCFPTAILTDAMPAAAVAVLSDYLVNNPTVCEDDFSPILGYLLHSSSSAALADIADCSEELANRLLKNRFSFSSFSGFCTLCKSRDITYTRLSRILLHFILTITTEAYTQGKLLDYIPYLRILGFRRDSSAILRRIKETASIPMLSKLADASRIISPDALWMLEKDIFAADLYELTIAQKAKRTASRSEYTREILIL